MKWRLRVDAGFFSGLPFADAFKFFFFGCSLRGERLEKEKRKRDERSFPSPQPLPPKEGKVFNRGRRGRDLLLVGSERKKRGERVVDKKKKEAGEDGFPPHTSAVANVELHAEESEIGGSVMC